MRREIKLRGIIKLPLIIQHQEKVLFRNFKIGEQTFDLQRRSKKNIKAKEMRKKCLTFYEQRRERRRGKSLKTYRFSSVFVSSSILIIRPSLLPLRLTTQSQWRCRWQQQAVQGHWKKVVILMKDTRLAGRKNPIGKKVWNVNKPTFLFMFLFADSFCNIASFTRWRKLTLPSNNRYTKYERSCFSRLSCFLSVTFKYPENIQ